MGSYTVVGNLGADPQLRWNPSGGAWATFTICETDRVVDRESGQWRDGASTWWEVKCSGSLAEHVAQSLRKGQRAFVQGQVGDEHWTAQDGSPRSRKRLRATAVGPELKWGVTTFALRSREEGLRRDEGLRRGEDVDRVTGVVTGPWDVPAPGRAPAAESLGAGEPEVGARSADRADGPLFDARPLVAYDEDDEVLDDADDAAADADGRFGAGSGAGVLEATA